MALTKIINNVQRNRHDNIEGNFACYSGLALPLDLIKQWSNQKYLTLDGYRSTSLNQCVARRFAAQAETDDHIQVILEIMFENKQSKFHICLDRPDYTMYEDE